MCKSESFELQDVEFKRWWRVRERESERLLVTLSLSGAQSVSLSEYSLLPGLTLDSDKERTKTVNVSSSSDSQSDGKAPCVVLCSRIV